jgi:hypothetical protein
MRFKKALPAMLVVVLVLMFSTSVSASEINSAQISPEAISNIKQNLAEMGVDQATQAKLIIKLQNGQAWDSMNPAMANEGSLTTNTFSDVSGNKIHQKKVTFPDGSVSVVNVTISEGASSSNGLITPFSVSGGTSSCGSGYCNYYGVKVSGGNGIITANFLADYSIVNGGYDSISKVYQGSAKAQIGSISNLQQPTILRASESSSQSASANMTWTYNGTVTGNATQYLILNVGSDSATSQFTT